MSYFLTLTQDERKAIDWVGYRYAHGNDLYNELWCESEVAEPEEVEEWDDPREITFRIPEHVAWEIQRIGEESEFRWDCFADELVSKLNNFCDHIV